MFLLVVTALAALIHLYLWKRLVRDPGWGPRTTRALTIAAVLLAALVPVTMVVSRSDPRGLSGALVSWPGFVWMGAHFLLFAVALVTEFPRAGVATLDRVRGRAADPSRRRLLARVVAGAAAGVAVPAVAAGIASAASLPRLEHVRVPLRRLPPEFDGFKIVQITDLHVGVTTGRAFVERVVALANSAGGDVIALTGDFVDGTVAQLGADLEPLRDLRAAHGVFFVTGNHEYYAGVDAWIARLTELGVRVLRNERVTIERSGASIDLAGIDDHGAAQHGNGHGADLAKALAGRDPARCVVLLAHQPRQVFDAVRAGVDLQLSGHTHGGQIFPFGFITRMVQPVLAGLERFGDTWIYVSRGTGTWGPPMRVACPSEVAVVELVPES